MGRGGQHDDRLSATHGIREELDDVPGERRVVSIKRHVMAGLPPMGGNGHDVLRRTWTVLILLEHASFYNARREPGRSRWDLRGK